ncbi:MAG: RNA polymerase sigma factor [Jatrophihabitantaceae bacterium]
MTQPLAATIADERLRIVAALIRVTGDWDLAEDCVQDAVERALVHWPRDGAPDNPAGWLTTTAHRRALDVLRRRRTEANKLTELSAWAERPPDDRELDPYGSAYGDDRLRLLFTCCHPALPLAGRVALTLKTVGGLSTREIARAFLVSEATMGQRLLRARNKIEHAGIRLRVPQPNRLAERTAGVLAVVYLIYNEGYATAETLADEAVRLARLVAKVLPDDDEVHGLRALLLLQHARRAARIDSAGDLVPMPEQDRSQWDSAMIAEGLASLATARSAGRPAGPYRLQAEIAAVHATAAEPAATDWDRIVAGYDALLELHPSPVVALNRAVAVGYRDGPDAGLTALAELAADELREYHLLPAVRADLLRRAGQREQAAIAYQQALGLADNPAVRRFLQRRLAETGTVED